MKKLFAALCLLCALSLPDFAKAEVNGVYVTPKFLMSILNTGSNSSDISAGGYGIFDIHERGYGERAKDKEKIRSNRIHKQSHELQRPPLEAVFLRALTRIT